ncbi:MAG: hypothetical protein QNK37_35865, partial [Acidobacteriota bacterium]|nr:hypothetical protein [Acidobacteriota bacterium]
EERKDLGMGDLMKTARPLCDLCALSSFIFKYLRASVQLGWSKLLDAAIVPQQLSTKNVCPP